MLARTSWSQQVFAYKTEMNVWTNSTLYLSSFLFSAIINGGGKSNSVMPCFLRTLPNLHFIFAPLTQPPYSDSLVVTYSHACSYLLTCKFLLSILRARYMRSLDVISEVSCVLLRSEPRFQFISLYQNFWRYIRTTLRFTKEEADVRKRAPPFLPARYIINFDVISEVIAFYQRGGKILIKRL